MGATSLLQDLIQKLEDNPDILEDLKNRMEEEKKYSIRQRERIDNFISNLSKEEFEYFFFNTYVPWEKDYALRYYNKGIEAISNIYDAFLNYIRYYGEEFHLEDEDFFSEGFRMGDYKITTYCGQGCFTRLEYKDEIIISG